MCLWGVSHVLVLFVGFLDVCLVHGLENLACMVGKGPIAAKVLKRGSDLQRANNLLQVWGQPKVRGQKESKDEKDKDEMDKRK